MTKVKFHSLGLFLALPLLFLSPVAVMAQTQTAALATGTFLRNTGLVVSGAVAGHYLGKKTGLSAGTLGGAAGASAVVLNSPGGEVVVKRGTTLRLKLNKPLEASAAKP